MCHNFLMRTVTKMKRVTDKQIQLCTHRTRSTCMQLAAAGISRQKGSVVPGRLGIWHWGSPMGIELPKKHSQWDYVRRQNGQKVVEPNSGGDCSGLPKHGGGQPEHMTRIHTDAPHADASLDETICSWVFQWWESELDTELAANLQISNRTMSPFISAAEENVSFLTGHKRPLHLWITQQLT